MSSNPTKRPRERVIRPANMGANPQNITQNREARRQSGRHEPSGSNRVRRRSASPVRPGPLVSVKLEEAFPDIPGVKVETAGPSQSQSVPPPTNTPRRQRRPRRIEGADEEPVELVQMGWFRESCYTGEQMEDTHDFKWTKNLLARHPVRVAVAGNEEFVQPDILVDGEVPSFRTCKREMALRDSQVEAHHRKMHDWVNREGAGGVELSCMAWGEPHAGLIRCIYSTHGGINTIGALMPNLHIPKTFHRVELVFRMGGDFKSHLFVMGIEPDDDTLERQVYGWVREDLPESQQMIESLKDLALRGHRLQGYVLPGPTAYQIIARNPGGPVVPRVNHRVPPRHAVEEVQVRDIPHVTQDAATFVPKSAFNAARSRLSMSRAHPIHVAEEIFFTAQKNIVEEKRVRDEALRAQQAAREAAQEPDARIPPPSVIQFVVHYFFDCPEDMDIRRPAPPSAAPGSNPWEQN
ncbi:hypothetical protein BJ508DRAFT_332255 [Ascobolus immersus RN42]|uniref:Uncharacterized protein n=1 Tax=Ascobolus immersus RN42 TaxID=1160509 RepID=A0A3N4HTH0_ASCIM|nr:hypothetical protein BJ508DRAFT_332255 [Ascobolus immersus RN42]